MISMNGLIAMRLPYIRQRPARRVRVWASTRILPLTASTEARIVRAFRKVNAMTPVIGRRSQQGTGAGTNAQIPVPSGSRHESEDWHVLCTAHPNLLVEGS